MVLLLLLHDVDEAGFGDVVVLPEVVLQVLLPPVREGTAVVLVLPRRWPSDDIPAVLGSLGLFLPDQAIGVFDVIDVALEI